MRTALLFFVSLAAMSFEAVAATFTVTTNANDGDGSLRHAIQMANEAPGADTIAFNLDETHRRIVLTVPLPDVSGSTVLDASTNPGWKPGVPVVEVTACNVCLVFNVLGSDSVVRGFIINGYEARAIRITNRTIVAGNWLGLTREGLSSRGLWYGSIIVTGDFNRIGGTNVADRNVIRSRVEISGGKNVVLGNFFGTTSSGNTKVAREYANSAIWVHGVGVSENRIGGATPAERNIIATDLGVSLERDGAKGAIVQGNWFGIGADGGSLPSWESNTAAIYVGDVTGDPKPLIIDNLIQGYPGWGVFLVGAAIVRRNTVRNCGGGVVAVEGCGACNPNTQTCVPCPRNPDGSIIGGVDENDANTISGSTHDGVYVGPGTRSIEITSNRLYDNGVPIHLSFRAPNDPAPDADRGGNDLQNHPVLTLAVAKDGVGLVAGNLISAPSTPYLIQIFRMPFADSSQMSLAASIAVTTDATGAVAFATNVPGLERGDKVAATATNRGATATLGNSPNSTSELSETLIVVHPLEISSLSPPLLLALAAVLLTIAISSLRS